MEDKWSPLFPRWITSLKWNNSLQQCSIIFIWKLPPSYPAQAQLRVHDLTKVIYQSDRHPTCVKDLVFHEKLRGEARHLAWSNNFKRLELYVNFQLKLHPKIIQAEVSIVTSHDDNETFDLNSLNHLNHFLHRMVNERMFSIELPETVQVILRSLKIILFWLLKKYGNTLQSHSTTNLTWKTSGWSIKVYQYSSRSLYI